jgi:hypothetical protein
VIDFFSKHNALYPSTEITAETTAENLFDYYTTFGMFDQIFHDPGSVIQFLNQWMGIEDRVSLVDRHQSCRVEGINKQMLRHLRTLVLDERVLDKWSHVIVLKMVEFILDDSKNFEAGYKPFELKFGSDAATYFRLSKQLPPNYRRSSYCQFLNENLRNLRQIRKTYQDQLVQSVLLVIIRYSRTCTNDVSSCPLSDKKCSTHPNSHESVSMN